MKKQFLFLFLIGSLLLGGCGDMSSLMKEPEVNYEQTPIFRETFERSLFEDSEKLASIMDEFKNQPDLKGNELQVFQTVEINQSVEQVEVAKDKFQERYQNFIEIYVLKPGTKKDVVKYNYSLRDKWEGPRKVEIVKDTISKKPIGNQDISNNLIPMKNIRFEVLPSIYSQLKEKMKDLQEVRNLKIETDLQKNTLEPYWHIKFDAKKDDALILGEASFSLAGNLINYKAEDSYARPAKKK